MNIFGVGLPEVTVILVLALLIFGPKKLPELGKQLGKTLKSLKTASNEFQNEINQVMNESNEQSFNELSNIEDSKNINDIDISSDKFNNDNVLENDKDNMKIISTGGGTIVNHDSRELIESSTVILIKRNHSNTSGRALEDTYENLLIERKNIYETMSDYIYKNNFKFSEWLD